MTLSRDYFNALKASYNDWNGFLIDPNYYHDEKYPIISWHSRKTGFYKGVVTKQWVRQLRQERQFSIQIRDSSILQIYYKFYRDNLVEASLAYYSSKSVDIDPDESILSTYSVAPLEENFEEDNFEENISDEGSLLPVGWIRFDYDPSANDRGIHHHDCHMQISGFPQTRFVVSGVPTPRQFIEFVAASFYPTHYKNHRLHISAHSEDKGQLKKFWDFEDPRRIDDINDLCFPVQNELIYSTVSHFHIPISKKTVVKVKNTANTKTKSQNQKKK